MKKERKKVNIYFLIILLILVCAGIYLIYNLIPEKESPLYAPSDHSITRSFDKSLVLADELITVTLTVDTWDGNDDVYSIDERIPAGVEVVDVGDGTQSGNKLKWIVYNQDGTPVVDTTHTYTIRSSSIGIYTINGKYAFNDEKPAQNILGDSQFEVTTCIPSTEVCDGVDNDCDTFIDEDLTRATTCGVGICSGNTGTETCNLGVWGSDTCNPFAGSQPETCDGLDNSCDGNTDENPDLICLSLGAYTCISANCECTTPIEEDTLTFTGDCDGCVSPQELSNYVYEWKVIDNLEITQEEVTSSVHYYLTGITVC